MTERYDLVIVGAGIHGAGVAQAAAAAGHRVLVLEQSDIAAWTSSRSSKLIHGGLRYLETGQFGLVREALRERALLLRLAPTLVQLKRFHIPVYGDTHRSAAWIRLGLAAYSVLSGFHAAGRFRALPRAQWPELDGLDTAGLRTVFEYRDAQTDDRALTRAVMHSAMSLGAELAMPARFVAAELTTDGCVIDYRRNGEQRSAAAPVLINAAGAWVNRVLECIRPAVTELSVELVQGAHLIVDGRLARGVYYLEAPDRRAVFAMPWHDRILLGTTETPFSGDPAAVAPLPEERRYLLDTLARYFPRYRDSAAVNVSDAFAGLRVLPAGPQAAFRRSRETVLHADRADRLRVLSIYGGKLTTYRVTAAKVMRQIRSRLPERKRRALTGQLPLS